jgi:hypothetical protein
MIDRVAPIVAPVGLFVAQASVETLLPVLATRRRSRMPAEGIPDTQQSRLVVDLEPVSFFVTFAFSGPRRLEA